MVQAVMKTSKVGKSDVEATIIGLGTWAIGGAFWGGSDNKDAIDLIKEAVELGVNLIDTAPVYGYGLAEELVGKAIAGKRDKVIISTKCGLNFGDKRGTYTNTESGHDIYVHLAPTFLREELENSLRRLKTDYIDVYYTHWQEEITPLAEVMETLQKFKKEGKIRAIGASNLSLKKLQEYQEAGGIDVGQEEYSLLHRDIEREILPFCRTHEISMFAYCPLAQGLLTGKILPGHKFKPGDMRNKMKSFSNENLTKAQTLNKQLMKIADNYGATLAQLIIAWTVAQPGITHALCGARNAAQFAETIKAADINLSTQDSAEIRQLAENSGVTFKMFA